LLIYNAVTHYGENASQVFYLGAAVSILTNVIVSTSLIIRIRRTEREVEKLTRHTQFHWAQIPYTYLMFVLFESAFPPVALGLVTLALLPVYNYTGSVRLLWVSSTVSYLCDEEILPLTYLFQVLSPQIIALRVLKGRNRTQPTLCSVPTMPIAFHHSADSEGGSGSPSGISGIAFDGASRV
jgi:hypothetical protein